MPRDPIRCFDGNAKPHEPFWRFKDSVETESEEPELELYGYISEYSWFDDDITPKIFKDDLNKFGKGGPVTIRMNSGGGDMIAASVMRSIIKDYPGRVTVKIDGLAASAATLVALAGDKVLMQETAFFMIHDPSVSFFLASLNITDMEQILAMLKTAKSGIVDTYETRTGLNPEKLAKLMTNETWFSAREAVNYGFADEVITAGKNAMAWQATLVNAITPELMKQYVNIPTALVQPEAQLQPALVETGQPDTQNRAVDQLRAEIQLYL